MPFWIEGTRKPSTQNELSVGIWYAVQPNYLKAMGIPLLRGRFISPNDNETTPSIVVIDENFAREFFPNEDPIGKQIDTDLMGPLLRSEIIEKSVTQSRQARATPQNGIARVNSITR